MNENYILKKKMEGSVLFSGTIKTSENQVLKFPAFDQCSLAPL